MSEHCSAESPQNLPSASWVQTAAWAMVKSMLPSAGDKGDLQKSTREGLESSGKVSGGFRADSFNTAGSLDGRQGSREHFTKKYSSHWVTTWLFPGKAQVQEAHNWA